MASDTFGARVVGLVASKREVGWHIFDEIDAEISRASAKFPSADYPDGTGGGGRETWMRIAQHSCDRSHREGTTTWAHILDEECAEALAETDKCKLRAELLQVAAMACRWVAKLDREFAAEAIR